ncbi:MAG: type II toxin-antitoxin system VapC family toxin [Acidobacteria bacterium]|nr:type II toxin-antitoxin system VapC family toxin [Acidobacteriota bacterium]
MKLLLDTHIWLWSLLEPARLGRRTAAALEDPDNELWLSPISVWETLMLAERKRVVLLPDAEQWVRSCLARLPFHEAAVNAEVALTSRALKIPCDDPADRFLAATARVYELTLVTADARLRRIPHVAVLPNT